MYAIHRRYKAGGVTLQELAQEYGITISSAAVTVRKIEHGMPIHGYDDGYRPLKTVAYPVLEDWRREQGMSMEEMAEAAGMSAMTLRTVLTGKGYAKGAQEQGPRMSTIDKLLALTGLTYEEAFRRDDGNKDLQRR